MESHVKTELTKSKASDEESVFEKDGQQGVSFMEGFPVGLRKEVEEEAEIVGLLMVPILSCEEGSCTDLVTDPTSPNSSSSILSITANTALSFSLFVFLALISAVTNCVMAIDRELSPEVGWVGLGKEMKDGTGMGLALARGSTAAAAFITTAGSQGLSSPKSQRCSPGRQIGAESQKKVQH